MARERVADKADDVHDRGSFVGPDFLCVGLQKAGTAWLYDQLDSHPDFWMPPLKELHYFDKKSKATRYRDLIDNHVADVGGPENIGEPVKSILRRASELITELELLERKFVVTGGTPEQLESYQSAAKSVKQLLEGVGLERPGRDRVKIKRLDKLLRRMQSDRDGLNSSRARQGKRPLGDGDLEFLRKVKTLQEPVKNIEKYAGLFESKGDLLTGDITPGYSQLPENIIQAISRHFPALKIVLLLRDPIDRSWSQLNMQLRKRKLKEEATSDWDGVRASLTSAGISARSYPSDVWRRWSRFFPPERFRYFFFDDLCRDPVGFRSRILEFLGADPTKASGDLSEGHNRKTNFRKVDMTPEIREHMIQFFREELLACERDFGDSAREWLTRYGLSLEMQIAPRPR